MYLYFIQYTTVYYYSGKIMYGYIECSLSLQIIAFMVLLAVSHTSCMRVSLYQERIREKGRREECVTH